MTSKLILLILTCVCVLFTIQQLKIWDKEGVHLSFLDKKAPSEPDTTQRMPYGNYTRLENGTLVYTENAAGIEAANKKPDDFEVSKKASIYYDYLTQRYRKRSSDGTGGELVDAPQGSGPSHPEGYQNKLIGN